MKTRAVAHVGQHFGRWLVLRDAPRDHSYKRRYFCRCVCGTERAVDAWALRVGRARSCGCLASDATRARNFRHGGASDAEYNVWALIKRRCRLDPRYAGRGIRMCRRWERSYAAFLGDMGRRPSPKHTIERIDNAKGYTPTNCCWATRRVQANNRENTLRVTVDGVQVSVADAARRRGISYYTLRQRLRTGWPVAEALRICPRTGGHYRRNRGLRWDTRRARAKAKVQP